MDKTIMDKRES